MNSSRQNKALRSVFNDRLRTNLLKNQEQKAIIWLLQRLPSFITSNILTFIGFLGNMIVSGSFVLASFIERKYMLFGILGFAISWFGDSLDGRLAYYRNRPRKNYGFTLDITIDWLSIILIGLGYIIYAVGRWELLGYGFVVMYGWEMIIALIRYRITGRYSIDIGIMGPTEVRIIIGLIMILEVVIPGSIHYSAAIVVLALLVVNIIDTVKILKVALEIDKKEMKKD